jgi:alpha-mannosidase
VASLIIESGAPGCRKLRREVRLTAGLDSLELINTVDKERLKSRSYFSREGKEGVHFAFPFNVPGGQIRLDIPWAVMRPELDQIPGSCKNWLTVGRWADVSNDDFGVTWITLDAPLVEVGGITATLLNSQTDPRVWRKRIDPTQRLYSWVMNNHWGTNYRAYQEGPVVFRYLLRPHLGFDPAEASRQAISRSQPLLAVPARGAAPPTTPLLQLEREGGLIASLKPSDDRRAWIIRIFGAGGRTVKTPIVWKGPGPKDIWLSNTSEQPLQKWSGPIEVPGYGLVVLRIERASPPGRKNKDNPHDR